MQAVLFEDETWKQLLPLVYLRDVGALRCGMDTLAGRLERVWSRTHTTPVDRWCRPELAPVVAEQTSVQVNAPLAGMTALFNSRGLWTALPEGLDDRTSWVGVAGPQEDVACLVLGADRVPGVQPRDLLSPDRREALIHDLPRRQVDACVTLVDWPWDLVHANERMLGTDWTLYQVASAQHGTVHEGSYLLNESAIYIGPGAIIKPCAVIDATEGPVYIAEDVTVHPHVTIQGPAYIGPGCTIKPGAVLTDGVSLGPVCKVGGEVEATIIQGYSNKQHDGFLGHSYLGSWVNIAADSINSDLKNTYGTIRMPMLGTEVETGHMFMGLVMGDHSKSGINVSFPTGAVIGCCSSIFVPMSPKYVPSFSWITPKGHADYDLERGVDLARTVMGRRDVSLTPLLEARFRAVHDEAAALERR